MNETDDVIIIRFKEEKKSFREIGRILGISHVAARKRFVKAIARVNSENETTVKTTGNEGSSLLRIVKVQATFAGIPDEGSKQVMELPTAASQALETNNAMLTKVDLANASTDPVETSTVLLTKSNIPLKKVETYLIHRPTGRVVIEGARAYPKGDLEPYTPPKFLRKIDGANKGKLFPWTYYLAQRKDMIPFEGDPSELFINQVTNQIGNNAETTSEAFQPHSESPNSKERQSVTSPPQYLKKMGTPDWNYHVATPGLLAKAEREKELFPYDPKTKRFFISSDDMLRYSERFRSALLTTESIVIVDGLDSRK